MSPSDNRPIQAGRLPPLRPNVPQWIEEGKPHSPFRESWAMSDRVYPTHVALSVDPGVVTEHVRVLDAMRGEARLHTVAVSVHGWGEVAMSGMIDEQDRAGRFVVATQLDYELARDLVGLQLDAPLDWQWLPQPRLSELMVLRARVMLLGLVATWTHHKVHDLGPSGSVLNGFARQWHFEGEAAVYQSELFIDVRDPTQWK